MISEVGQGIEKSQCQETISPEKHSLASPDDKRGSQDASFHCKNVKGMLNLGGKEFLALLRYTLKGFIML